MRKESKIVFNEIDGENSSLSVSYQAGGRNAGQTAFTLNKDNEISSFHLSSKDEAIALANYLLDAVNNARTSTAPSFETTGYGIKVICNETEIKRVYDNSITSGGIEGLNYGQLRKAFPDCKSDDFFFVVYALKDKGMSRDTLEKIIDACLDCQRPVLISGDLRLFKPMTQLTIANITGLDNTTVSRAAREVRVFTVHRNYSLDRNGQQVSLDFPSLFSGELDGKSVVAIKLIIRSLIAAEDKANPYTDEELALELKRFGYDVARRTVRKYRDEHLGIPNSNVRRVREA